MNIQVFQRQKFDFYSRKELCNFSFPSCLSQITFWNGIFGQLLFSSLESFSHQVSWWFFHWSLYEGKPSQVSKTLLSILVDLIMM